MKHYDKIEENESLIKHEDFHKIKNLSNDSNHGRNAWYPESKEANVSFQCIRKSRDSQFYADSNEIEFGHKRQYIHRLKIRVPKSKESVWKVRHNGISLS